MLTRPTQSKDTTMLISTKLTSEILVLLQTPKDSFTEEKVLFLKTKVRVVGSITNAKYDVAVHQKLSSRYLKIMLEVILK